MTKAPRRPRYIPAPAPVGTPEGKRLAHRAILRVIGKHEDLMAGLPLFTFHKMPEAWRVLSAHTCLICGRGWRDGIRALWRYNATHFVCLLCRYNLRRGVMPPVHVASPIRGLIR